MTPRWITLVRKKWAGRENYFNKVNNFYSFHAWCKVFPLSPCCIAVILKIHKLELILRRITQTHHAIFSCGSFDYCSLLMTSGRVLLTKMAFSVTSACTPAVLPSLCAHQIFWEIYALDPLSTKLTSHCCWQSSIVMTYGQHHFHFSMVEMLYSQRSKDLIQCFQISLNYSNV